MNAPSFSRTTLRMFGGVIVWAAHFAFVYGFAALACARGFAELRLLGIGVTVWAIATASVLAAAAMVVLAAPALRARRRSFEGWVTASVSALALLAVAWESLAALGLPSCA
jgi:hypothetical protein